MTDEELNEYYANLLILQYQGQPNAYATIKAIVDMFTQNQILIAIQNAFNIDTAVGVQLDILGKYAGVTRYGYDFSGAVTLDDADFRILIQLKSVQNNSGSSLADIQNLLFTYFSGVLFVYDYANMHMSYVMSSTGVSESLAQVFVKQGLLPRPMGVQLASIVYLPVTNAYFGMRRANVANVTPNAAKGLNRTTSYNTNRHWIRTTDTI